MIDEYRYEKERGVFLGRVVSRGRLGLALAGAVLMVALQVVSVYYAARGSHTTIIVHGGSSR